MEIFVTQGKATRITSALWALTLAVFLAGCGDRGPSADQKKVKKFVSEQYLAIVAILPDDTYTVDQRQEKQGSLKRLIEDNGIGRVASSETRREIGEVVFQVTMEGDVRGILRGLLLEWDPSVSYAIDERRPSE
jgi:hypothetical protein